MKRARGGDEEAVQVLVERPSSFSHEDRHQQQQGAASLPTSNTSAAARPPHHHRQQQVIRARPYYRRWSPWLVSAATVACVAIFLVTMYVNDCPRHNSNCAAGFLGRLAFQPLRENPLLDRSLLRHWDGTGCSNWYWEEEYVEHVQNSLAQVATAADEAVILRKKP